MYTVLQQRALTQAVGFRHFENPLFPIILASQCLLHCHFRLRLLITSLSLIVVGFYHRLHFGRRRSLHYFPLGRFVKRVGFLGCCATFQPAGCFVVVLDYHIASVDSLVRSDLVFHRRNT
jgi:hypothetical protein